MEDKEKKAIIGLWGPGEKGKTQTLNLLIKSLGGPKGTVDQRVRLSYRKKRIAITTYGDNKEQLQENVDFFNEESCDIYVTATRTSGGSVAELEEFEKSIGWKAIWIYKSYLTYDPQNSEEQNNPPKESIDEVQSRSPEESNDKKETKPLEESITEEQIEIIRNTINRGLAKTIQSIIDQIITDWEK